MKAGIDEVHGQSKDVVRLKNALGWGYRGSMSGNNRDTESSVRGMTRCGLNGAGGMITWTNSKIVGTWTVGYSRFMDDVKQG